jgi:UDP-sugar diphosphatase
MVEVHDSVAVILYHEEKNALVVVRQFRPPVYLKNSDGFTYELCAGIVDKEKSLLEIVHEEILEECGFEVPLERIERVTSFYTAVGFAGASQTLYFARIDDGMKKHNGGGIDVESIEVIGEREYFASSSLFALLFCIKQSKPQIKIPVIDEGMLNLKTYGTIHWI